MLLSLLQLPEYRLILVESHRLEMNLHLMKNIMTFGQLKAHLLTFLIKKEKSTEDIILNTDQS